RSLPLRHRPIGGRQQPGAFVSSRRAPRRTGQTAAVVRICRGPEHEPLRYLGGHVKARRDDEPAARLQLHWGARSRSAAGPACGVEPASRASCSSKSRATSMQTFLCSRQNSVSVHANVPCSKYLFPGGPPPQKRKYLQPSRHMATPRSISSCNCRNRADATTASSESTATLP